MTSPPVPTVASQRAPARGARSRATSVLKRGAGPGVTNARAEASSTVGAAPPPSCSGAYAAASTSGGHAYAGGSKGVAGGAAGDGAAVGSPPAHGPRTHVASGATTSPLGRPARTPTTGGARAADKGVAAATHAVSTTPDGAGPDVLRANAAGLVEGGGTQPATAADTHAP